MITIQKCETSLWVGVGAGTNTSRPASVTTDQVIARVIIATEDSHLVVMTTSPRVGWTRDVGTAKHCRPRNNYSSAVWNVGILAAAQRAKWTEIGSNDDCDSDIDTRHINKMSNGVKLVSFQLKRLLLSTHCSIAPTYIKQFFYDNKLSSRFRSTFHSYY